MENKDREIWVEEYRCRLSEINHLHSSEVNDG